MQHVGLVLEGGGMRGAYTAGVLDFFIEKDLYFPYVIGVSAGACNALSYISKQYGRNLEIYLNYPSDKRYINYFNLLKGKGVFGMDFIFNDIPNKLVPFDYQTFWQSKQRFVTNAMDCDTGETVYFEKESCKDFLTAVIASSSLPVIGTAVKLNGLNLMDGGIVDPIPIRKSQEDGNSKNVIVLTRDGTYRKKPSKIKLFAKMLYPDKENIYRAMKNQYKVYNETLDYINKLQSEKKVFVIRPERPVTVSRIERNPQKLARLYDAGYQDAKKNYKEMLEWIKT
ncbi:patatin-like phospholipase family protein [Desulfofalx alkaliphila]|uniref:patatin-like phospholipase family protein n=1 Tax=Desulfofalx alkaliphila TaxID=105483 RepID=UPI0004E1AB36|nr:patatin family protein [Desulfofalx alkaliphila]